MSYAHYPKPYYMHICTPTDIERPTNRPTHRQGSQGTIASKYPSILEKLQDGPAFKQEKRPQLK